MEDNSKQDLKDLRSAIEGRDLAAVKLILSKCTIDQLRDELSHSIDGENLIEHALRLRRKIIAQELLIHSTVEVEQLPYDSKDFSWLKLFELTDRKDSILQLREKLKFAEPFAKAGYIDLESLLDVPKFVKIAISLGARPKSIQEFGTKILQLTPVLKDKQLFVWLVRSGICDKFPLDREYMISKHHIKNNHKFLMESLQSYPNWMLEKDEKGDNIFHFFLKKRVRRKYGPTWYNLWTLGRKDPEALINAVIQPNNLGEIPALLYINRKISCNSHYPNEFLIALKRLVESGQFQPLHKFFETEANNLKSRRAKMITMIAFYLMQCGYVEKDGRLSRMIRSQTRLFDYPYQNLFHAKCLGLKSLPKKEIDHEEAEKQPTNDEVKYCYLLEIPQELLHSIIANLSLGDITVLLSCNKTLLAMFKELSTDDSFWHGIPAARRATLNSKMSVGQHVKSRLNWYHNKYSTVSLSNYSAITMDEHWLLLHHDRYYHFWNCDTQELMPTTSVYHQHYHVMMNNYHNYDGPTVMDVAEWKILRGNTRCWLKNIRIAMQAHKNYSTPVIPIDHRIFVPYQTEKILYDIQKDQLIFALDEKSTPNAKNLSAVYNPYKEAVFFYDPNSGEKYLMDLRSAKMELKYDGKAQNQTIPVMTKCIFTDEHTAFFTESKTSPDATGAGFIDMRTMKPMYSATNLLTYHSTQLLTKNRMIFTSYNTRSLMSSWNFSSQKIEWMELVGEQCHPQTANSRYLVMAERHGYDSIGLVIRDFLA